MLLLLTLQVVDALKATRAETQYELTFESRTAIGNGDPLDRKGSVRWWKAGVQILDYEASGQQSTQAVRAGVQYGCVDPKHGTVFKPARCAECGVARAATKIPRVWIHDSVQGWMSADEYGQPSVASGFQNPDEVLGLLETYADQARAEKGVWVIALAGADAIKIANKLAPVQNLVAARISVTLRLDAGRISAMEIEANVQTKDGAGLFTASARLGSFGRVAVPNALGPAKKPVQLGPVVGAAVAEQLR